MPIGPVSETGRAMMASLQQAMAKGMPVDQAIQYVKGMATQGVAPMTDLYAMLNQFQRLKQPKMQAPQVPPTLKDQLSQLSQAQDAIDRGIGSLPAPSMERASFAGGGIVAFDEGGVAGIDWSKMTPEELDQLINDPDPEVMRKARKELVGRFSMSPSDIASDIADLYRKSWAVPEGVLPLIKFSNERKFPGYMYDEKGNVRRGQVSAGIGGVNEFSPGQSKAYQKLTEQGNPQGYMAPKKAEEVKSPAAVAASQLPPTTTFDDMVARARSKSDQMGTPYDISTKDKDKEKGRDKEDSTTSKRYKDLEDLIPKEGTLAEYLEEVRKAKGENAAEKEYRKYLKQLEAGGAEQDERANNLAIAKAGFAMAEAAGRRGKERTGLLGAAAIGGSTYAGEQEKIAQRIQARKEKLAESYYKLEEAKRREDTDDVRAAMQEVKANQRAITQARGDITKLRIAEEGATARANIADRRAAATEKGLMARNAAVIMADETKNLIAYESSLRKDIMASAFDPNVSKEALAEMRADLTRVRRELARRSSLGGPMTTGTQLGGNIIDFGSLK